MKNSFLLVLLIILPIALACEKLETLTDPAKKEIKPGIKKVKLPDNTEFSEENLKIRKEDSVIISVDDRGFYLGETLHSTDQGKELLSSLMSDKTPENRIIYINSDSDTSYDNIVKFLDQVRKADIDKVGFIVKTKDNSESHLGVLEAKLPAEPNENIDIMPNPLTLVVNQTKSGQITLNNENMTLAEVQEKLAQVFREREDNGVFRVGTNEIEKTVFIKSALSNKYGDVIKMIDAVKGASASPIGLQMDDLPQ